MTCASEELLAQMVQRLVDALHPLEIWLFGSQVSGKAHKHSDIDLMVVVRDDAPDSTELAKRAYPFLPDRPCGVDLIFVRRRDMTQWSNVKFSLPYEATHKGRLIYAARSESRATVA